jgi:hypothetical protein
MRGRWTLPRFSNRAAARWAKEGSTVVSTVKGTGAATSSMCHTASRLQTNARAEPAAWPTYQTRKVWNDSQTPLRQNHACRLHDRDGHAPLGRRCAAEVWVMPEDGPSQVSRRAAAWFWLWSLNFSWPLGGVPKFKNCNFISNFSMDETPLATIFKFCIRPLR